MGEGEARMEGDKVEKMSEHGAEGFDLNPLHRSTLPRSAAPQDLADTQKVAQIFCSQPGSRHGFTIWRVSEPREKREPAQGTRAGSLGPAAWCERDLLDGLRASLPAETLAWLQTTVCF